MTIEQSRSKIIAGIWQGVAQSGVDLATIPQEQQEKLVSKIADSVMITLNSMLDEVIETGEFHTEQDDSEEQVVWQGRPFLSPFERYIITTERIKLIKGWLGHNVENYELIRMQDMDWSQGVSERMVGVGDITIRGQDPSDPEIVLRNVSKPEEVYETLRKVWLEARKRYGLQFREYM